jgi:hypothetical protein
VQAPIAFTDSITIRVVGYNGAAGPLQPFACTLGVDCVQVAPEPSTLAMVGTGLIGLAFWLPRRNRRARGYRLSGLAAVNAPM